jgi:hypothetical protein
MAAFTAALAIGSIAASAYSANRASRNARSAQRSAENAREQQIAEADKLRTLAEGRYDEWRQTFLPGVQRMGELAMQEARPDYERIDADVATSFDTSQDANRRQMARYGVDPSDGAMAASERNYGIGRALATVSGRNVARRNAQQDQWQKLAGFVGAGEGMRSGADNLMSSAYNGIFSAWGGSANANQQIANTQQQQSNAAWSDAASGLGYMAGNWGSMGGGNPGFKAPVSPTNPLKG